MLKIRFYFFIIILGWNFFCWSQNKTVHQFINNNQQPSVFDQTQLVNLKILVAAQFLHRAEQTYHSKWMTLLQKNQLMKDASRSLSIYIKLLDQIKDVEEKSKLYFRIGYLYKILGENQKAFDSYEKVLSMSNHFHRIKQAYQISNEIKKNQFNSNKILRRKVVSLDQFQKDQSKSILKIEQDLLKVQEYLQSSQWKNAVYFFKQACQKYSENYPCYSNKCSNFSSSIRYIIQLAQERFVKESQWLNKIYEIYLSYFPRDLLVSVSAAQWALDRKDYERSMEFYQRHILFEKKFIHNNISKIEEKKERFKNLESIFYFHQKIAHLSKKPDLKIQSYNFYLSNSVEKEFISRVTYLKNIAFFHLGEYEKVAPLFRQIAMASQKETSIREKAAVFAIKSLLKMNQKVTAQKWAAQFLNLFPNKKLIFKQLFDSHRFS